MATSLVPTDSYTLRRFGKGDPERTRAYMLMVAAFLEGRPHNTKLAYRRALKQFFGLFEWISPEDVTPAHVAAFKKWLIGQRLADATVYTRLSALSSFFDFLRTPPSPTSEPLLKYNPCKAIPRNDVQPTPYAHSRAMDWPTFEKIFRAIPTDPMGLRDRAILLFFAYTGRRRAEVARLRIRDLDVTSRPRTYTVKLKGGDVDTFELPDICYEAISTYWIAAERLQGLRPEQGVFAPLYDTALTRGLDPGRPLSVRAMNEIFTRAVQRAGLPQRDPAICIHAIRHMSARDLDKAGVTLQEIQRFLRHKNPNTTLVYLGRLSGPRSAHTDTLMRVRAEAAALARSATADG